MTFWEHLEELRYVLFRSLLVLGIAMIGMYIAMPFLFDQVVMAPCRTDFILYRWLNDMGADGILGGTLSAKPVSIINIGLATQFMTHMTLSMWGAFLVSFPIMLYFIWRFVCPGLYPHERKGIVRTFIFGGFLFFLGIALAYYILFPITLQFLIGYELSATIQNTLSLESYMDNFFTLLLLMGIVFELPIVMYLLSKLGIVSGRFFRTYRRHAIVVLLIIAAIITPTGDPFTLILIFTPLYLLYEVSAAVVRPRKDL